MYAKIRFALYAARLHATSVIISYPFKLFPDIKRVLHCIFKNAMGHPLFRIFVLKYVSDLPRVMDCMQIALQLICAVLRET